MQRSPVTPHPDVDLASAVFNKFILMNNGELALYVESLTDDMQGDMKSVVELALTEIPQYIFRQSGGPHGFDSPIEVFMLRKVYHQQFGYQEQALIKPIGGGHAWINLPERANVLRNPKYDEAYSGFGMSL